MSQTNAVLRSLLVNFYSRSQLVRTQDDLDDLLQDTTEKVHRAFFVQDDLLTEKDVSVRWRFLTLSKLRNMRFRNQGPKYIKTGEHRNSRVYYKVADVERWIVEHYQMEPFVDGLKRTSA